MTRSSPDRPRIRLKPKANARRVRHGFPWVYANEIVADRRTRNIPAGTLAVLEDDSRTPLALVTVNMGSKIMCRILDRDPAADLTAVWFETRIQRALDLRERLYANPYYRLIHAEADGLPGVIIDRFDHTCVIQPNAVWADAHLDMLCDAVVRV
ncbi:MAG: RlmI/RlmK family 23S rRNA methyltransferase, partial [Pseudomonadota bacterium]